MTGHETLRRALSESFGGQIARMEPVHGGDINDAFHVQLAGGRELFVKTHARPPRAMYALEAAGLGYLDEARALRIPRVHAVTERFLALEWIAPGARGMHFDEQLGRGLATLHKFGAPCFGHAHDNYIGSILQHNREGSSWPAFYGEQRLLARAQDAQRAGTLPRQSYARIEKLCAKSDRLCGDAEPPARLHGDLWSGNVMVDAQGAPVLIDPAVYGGDREIDLAMLQLFGSPSARFFAAYDEVYPRKAGAQERVALYQLYPLLVHVCLFGASYLSQLERALSRYD